MKTLTERMATVATATALLTAAGSTGVASAASDLPTTYSGLYHAVADKHGDQAPGRNIRAEGVAYTFTSKDGKRSHEFTRDATNVQLAASIRELRRLNDPPIAPVAAPAAAAPPTGGAGGGTLGAIAACESGGDPTAVSPSGQYRGKYQFDQQTWNGAGGSGDPAAASEAAQDAVAEELYDQRGAQPWPVCGK